MRGGSSACRDRTATAPINDALQQFGPLASLLGAGKGPGSTDASANGVVPASARMQAGSDYDLQNEQERKQAFIEQTRGRAINNYLKSTRTPALGKYEVKMGWDIPAILEQGINSDLPGEVKALVRSNVYDTATGKYLLIPQGSRTGWSLRLPDRLRTKPLAGHLVADHLPRWQLDQSRWNDGPGHSRHGWVSRQG